MNRIRSSRPKVRFRSPSPSVHTLLPVQTEDEDEVPTPTLEQERSATAVVPGEQFQPEQTPGGSTTIIACPTTLGQRLGINVLWERALTQIQETEEDDEIREAVKLIATRVNLEMQENHLASAPKIATEIQDRLQQAANTPYHRNEMMYKIVKWLSSAIKNHVSAGDLAVSIDPLHAVPPWIAVRLALMTATTSIEIRDHLNSGIAYVASLILQCQALHRIFIGSDITEPDEPGPLEESVHELEVLLVEAYATILIFLGFASCYNKRRAYLRVISAPFRLGAVENHIGKLQEKWKKLEQKASECGRAAGINTRKQLDIVRENSKDMRHVFDEFIYSDLYREDRKHVRLTGLHIVDGAEYNDRNNDEVGYCFKGTRLKVLDKITDWACKLDDNNPSPSVFWLQGMAGTGKSAIAYTMAEILDNRDLLGASFFFRRNVDGRDNASHLFTTIAAQLVRLLPALAEPIANALEALPNIGNKALRIQFNKLVLEPLQELHHRSDLERPSTVVIVIDALDECQESDVLNVVKCLCLKTLINVRLKVLLTSRPDIHVNDAFATTEEEPDLILHQVDDTIEDIRIFTILEIERILASRTKKNKKQNLQTIDDWPGPERLDKLINMANPLFILARTAIRILEDRNIPLTLDAKLQNIFESGTAQNDSVEHRIAATYAPVVTILETLSEGERHGWVTTFQKIVGPIVVLVDPLPAYALARLLGLPMDEVTDQLEKLHSVLIVPDDQEDEPVRLFHDSFRMFVVGEHNKQRNPAWVSEVNVHCELAERCLDLISEIFKTIKGHKNICGIQSTVERSDIVPDVLRKALPPELRYACRYWVRHLRASGQLSSLKTKIAHFMTSNFLFWLESLSLLGWLSESLDMIRSLQSLLQSEQQKRVSCYESDVPETFDLGRFLREAEQFLLANFAVIDQTPLQLYGTALLFCPANALIKKVYWHLKIWARAVSGVEQAWKFGLQTLRGHTMSVRHIAVSSNGLLASIGLNGSVRVWNSTTGKSVHILTYNFTTDLPYHLHSADLAFSQDGKKLALLLTRGETFIWDTADGECLQSLESFTSARVQYEKVYFSKKGEVVRIACCDDAIYAQVYHSPSSQRLRYLRSTSTKSPSQIEHVAMSPVKECIAAGSVDGSVQLWKSWDSDPCVPVLFGLHGDSIRAVAFSADGTILATSSNDKTIRLWDSASRKVLRILEVQIVAELLTFSPDGRMVAYRESFGDRVQLWDVVKDVELGIFNNFSTPAALEFLPGSKSLALASEDSIRLLELTSLPTQKNLDGSSLSTSDFHQTAQEHSSSVKEAIFSPDGKTLATRDQYDEIILWDSIKCTCRRRFLNPQSQYSHTHMIFSPDSKKFAFKFPGQPIEIWSVSEDLIQLGIVDTEQANSVKMTSSAMRSANFDGFAFSAQSSSLAVKLQSNMLYDDEGEVYDSMHLISLWHLEETDCFFESPLTIVTPAISLDGRMIAYGLSKTEMQLMIIDSGEIIASLQFEELPRQFGHAIFSNDCRYIGLVDGGLLLWNIATRENLAKFPAIHQLQEIEDLNFDMDDLAVLNDGALVLAARTTAQSVQRLARMGFLVMNLTDRKYYTEILRALPPCVSFSKNARYVCTELGEYELNDGNLGLDRHELGPKESAGDRAIRVDTEFIYLDGEKILATPHEALVTCIARRDTQLVLGFESGRVVFLDICDELAP